MPNDSLSEIPRARPLGKGFPQPDICATPFNTARCRGESASMSRRNSNGSFPAASASSSTNDSMKKPWMLLSTLRHGPNGIGSVPEA